MAELLPLFPLSTVLLPGMPLPLHIFEPRYRQLLVDVRRGEVLGAFGVVALRAGSEAGTDQDIEVETVGTVAEIVEIETRPDGRADLLAVGSRRFRVTALRAGETPYLLGEVDDLPEEDGDLREADAITALRLYSQLRRLLVALTGQSRDEELPTDPNLLSYHVAASLPLGSADKQALLAEPTAAGRLNAEIRLLRRELRLIQSTRSVAIAPSVLRISASAN